MTDEYEGQGGRYVMDPVTGKRKLVQRTLDAAAVPAPVAPVVEMPPDPAPPHDKETSPKRPA